MKKPASSFSKRKRLTSRRRPGTSTPKQRVRRAVVKRPRRAKISTAALEQPVVRQAVGEPAAIAPLPVSSSVTSPAAQEPVITIESFDAAAGVPALDEFPAIRRSVKPTADSETRRAMMWAGVAVAMFMVVAGWAWTLRYTLNLTAASPIDTVPLTRAQDQFSDLYQKVTKSLDRLQSPPVVSPAAASLFATPTLTPEQVNILKSKLEAATPPATPAR